VSVSITSHWLAGWGELTAGRMGAGGDVARETADVSQSFDDVSYIFS